MLSEEVKEIVCLVFFFIKLVELNASTQMYLRK